MLMLNVKIENSENVKKVLMMYSVNFLSHVPKVLLELKKTLMLV